MLIIGGWLDDVSMGMEGYILEIMIYNRVLKFWEWVVVGSYFWNWVKMFCFVGMMWCFDGKLYMCGLDNFYDVGVMCFED